MASVLKLPHVFYRLQQVIPVRAKRKLFTQDYEFAKIVELDHSIRSKIFQPNETENIKWNNGGAPAYLYKTPYSVKKILEPQMYESPAIRTPIEKS